MAERPLCIVTGLSGAGKSTALRAFEDLNFFTVDGLPASLAPDIAKMLDKPAMSHFAGMAIGMDLRETGFLEDCDSALSALEAAGRPVRLVFLDASDEELLRRYAATRRPHPLEKRGIGLASAVQEERKMLGDLRKRADLLIDSTGYSIYDLKRAVHAHFCRGQAGSQMRVNVVSFGFKYGIPDDADYVFDARFLDNPYFVERLRPLSGLDDAVAAHVFESGAAEVFLRKTLELMEFVLPQMQANGRSRVTIAFGCTGGRHRSVALAQKFATMLAGFSPLVEHRNIEDDPARSGN